jgi:hypothetical protein
MHFSKIIFLQVWKQKIKSVGKKCLSHMQEEFLHELGGAPYSIEESRFHLSQLITLYVFRILKYAEKLKLLPSQKIWENSLVGY